MLSTWEAIFPTPVLMANIGRELSEEEKAFFVRTQSNTVENVFNRRSASTCILDADELRSLRSFIEEHIAQFSRETFSLKESLEFYITQSWVNYTKPGQGHHRHCHTNSLISGVFYVSAVKGVDAICFYRDASFPLSAGDEVPNCYSANSWRFTVGAGDLILFPSRLTHGVANNTSKHIRVSLAFNAFVRGELGSEELLNRLTL